MVCILLSLSSLMPLSSCTSMHTHTTHPYMHIACSQFRQQASQLLKIQSKCQAIIVTQILNISLAF